MYILNIASSIKKMSFNEIRESIFTNYYKRIEFSKNKQLLFKEISEKNI